MQTLLFEHIPGQSGFTDDFGKNGNVISLFKMIPHVPQLKFTHHAYFIDPAMSKAIVEKGPVEILIFRLLRVYACIKGHFLQGVGNSARFYIVGTPGSAGMTEQAFPR